MKVRTKVRSGKLVANHNTRVRSRGVKIRTNIRSGKLVANHNTRRV
jgi:hypothetical protein